MFEHYIVWGPCQLDLASKDSTISTYHHPSREISTKQWNPSWNDHYEKKIHTELLQRAGAIDQETMKSANEVMFIHVDGHLCKQRWRRICCFQIVIDLCPLTNVVRYTGPFFSIGVMPVEIHCNWCWLPLPVIAKKNVTGIQTQQVVAWCVSVTERGQGFLLPLKLHLVYVYL